MIIRMYDNSNAIAEDVRKIPATPATMQAAFSVHDEDNFITIKRGESEAKFHIRGVIQCAYVPCAENLPHLLKKV